LIIHKSPDVAAIATFAILARIANIAAAIVLDDDRIAGAQTANTGADILDAPGELVTQR
jgi:hypothetical protein